MDVTSIPSVGLPMEELRSGEAAPGNSGRNLAQVAAEFESLLLGEMLKSFREAAAAGGLGESDDQASQTMMELAEQQFARTLAAQGGLGLRDLIVKGLSGPELAGPESAGQDAPEVSPTQSPSGR